MNDMHQHLSRAFMTSDFNFAAFVLAYQSPKVRVVDLLRRVPPEGGRSYYEFVLCSLDGSDITRELDQLAVEYSNERTRVEPTSFTAARDRLRTLIVNHNSRHRKEQDEGAKAGSGKGPKA